MARLAYLGPAGTYAEAAALAYAPKAELVPCASVQAVARVVEGGEADEGIVPIENSVEGSVNITLDILVHESPLVIANEIVIDIDHALVSKPGDDRSIEVVYSHPQALAQCREYLDREHPGVELVASLSTSAAVQEVMASDRPAAAVAPRRAAELYGARIVAEGIQDSPSNQTRFVVLAHEDRAPTGNDKTSICFSLSADRSGGLWEVLSEFAFRSINLTKIESRPSKDALGKYVFLIDLEGHREDPLVKDVLARIEDKSMNLRVFGSYPRYRT